MRVFCVVGLHPLVDPQQRCARVRDRVYPNVVALECLHECLGHAVALGAFDRREARLEVQGRSNLKGAICGEDGSIVGQPFTLRGARMSPNRCSTQCTIISRIISPEIPAVVATQLMTSRSWLSRAKATRTISPFQQVNSSASEHQRSLEQLVMIVPSWTRGMRRPICRASNNPFFFINR